MMKNELDSNKLPSSLEAKDAMKVPQGYFNDNSVLLKSIAKNEDSKKTFTISPFLKWSAGIAASIALIIFFSVSNTNQVEYELSSDEIYSLFESGYIDFTDDEFAAIDLSDMSIADLSSELEFNTYINENLIYHEDELFFE